jgi:hypothetical protein
MTTLRDLLDGAADDPATVRVTETTDGAEWSIGETVFAALAGGTASFRLDTVLAGAALRTPDTAPSRRGAGWVEFSPPELEQMAVDRAVAWFRAAARRARGDT